jgi:hypothetical protein
MSKQTIHLREYFDRLGSANKTWWAKKIGVNLSSLHHWLRGTRACTDKDNLQAIFDATDGNVDANSMFGIDTSKERLEELKKAKTAKNNLTSSYNGHF